MASLCYMTLLQLDRLVKDECPRCGSLMPWVPRFVLLTMQLEEVHYGCPLVHVVGANVRGRLLALAVEDLDQVSSPGAEEICPDNPDLEGQQVVVVHRG